MKDEAAVMSIQDASPEQLAELFHHYHHVLAPDFGFPDVSAQQTWERLPKEEKSRMVAAFRLALIELSDAEKGSRQYFAKPGEAEWGC
jgi:hypothetical protein